MEGKRLAVEMEQLLGDFENLNLASNEKLDSIKKQYSQDDTGIVDTGDTSGVAAPKDVDQMDPTGEGYKKMYINQRTHSKSHGQINIAT